MLNKRSLPFSLVKTFNIVISNLTNIVKLNAILLYNFLLNRCYKTKNYTKKNTSKLDLDKTLNNQLLHNISDFNNKKVEDIIITRSKIVAININITLTELVKLFIEKNHTRLVVYCEDIDNILGFIHIKDLILILANNKDFNITALLRSTIIITPSMKLTELFKQMQSQRTHLAVVLDEYGSTCGIVTMEDILEVIFGAINDEHDTDSESDDYRYIDNSIIADASLSIKKLEQLVGKLENITYDCETLGGLITIKNGHLPSKGSVIELNSKIKCEVIDANSRSLKKIKIIIN